MTTALVVVEACAIALLALLVAGLLRSHAEILRALHELGAGIDPDAENSTVFHSAAAPGDAPARDRGVPAADLEGLSPHGEPLAIGVVGARHRTLLAFLSSGCLTCHGFWAALDGDAERSLPRDTRVVIITKGDDAESVTRVSKLSPRHVPVMMSSAAWGQYGVPVAPYFVLVDGPTGRVVGEGAAGTWDHVMRLMRDSLDDEHAGAESSDVLRSRGTWAEREAHADDQLRRAGIHPGHASLYPTAEAPDARDPESGRRWRS
jgi:hypothetical protein